MLEALLLTAMTGSAAPLAENRAPTRPSLELLEFLGEFGDDEDGVFEDETGTPATPTTPAAKPPAQPPSKVPPASAKEPA